MELIRFEDYVHDFIWDTKMHFPIPTIKYILSRTGINISDRYDTTVEADGFIVGVTRTAKNYIFKDKLIQDIQNTEYLLAHNLNALYEALEFICEFTKTALVSGDYNKLFSPTERKFTIPAIENAFNQLSFSRKIVIDVGEYYNGY